MTALRAVTLKERDRQIVRMCKKGATLEEAGEAFGVTRQRAHQICRAHGVVAEEIGAAIKYKKNEKRRQQTKLEKEAEKEREFQKKTGYTTEEYDALCLAMGEMPKGTPYLCFRTDRNNAATRNIPWNLSFKEWAELWLESGKATKRGQGLGSYCLSRIDRTKGYELSNVRIEPFVKACRY